MAHAATQFGCRLPNGESAYLVVSVLQVSESPRAGLDPAVTLVETTGD